MKNYFLLLLIGFFLQGCSYINKHNFKCVNKKDSNDVTSFTYRNNSGTFGNMELKLCEKRGNEIYFYSINKCSPEEEKKSVVRISFDVVSNDMSYFFQISQPLVKNYTCSRVK